MNYSDILLEFKITTLSKQLKEKLLNRAYHDADHSIISRGILISLIWPKNFTNEQSIENLINTILEADPSPSKKNTLWMIHQYVNGNIIFADLISTLSEDLKKYEYLKKKRFLPEKFNNIFNFRNLEEFFATVQSLHSKIPLEPEKKGRSTEFINNSEVRVIVPFDEEAAKYYGRGTTWCTAANKNNFFNEFYSPYGKLFIVIPKNPNYPGEKYQLYLPGYDNVDIEFTDELNTPVENRSSGYTSLNTGAKEISKANGEQLMQKYPTLATLIQLFAKRNSQWKAWLERNSSISESNAIYLGPTEKINNKKGWQIPLNKKSFGV